MKRIIAMAMAFVTVAGLTSAKEKKSEATDQVDVKTTTVTAKARKEAGGPSKGFAARMEETWKAVGCSDEEIAKLKELMAQRVEASKAKDQAKVKEITEEINKILTPERRAKMRELRRGPSAAPGAETDKSTTSAK